jgi:hypothetical protein
MRTTLETLSTETQESVTLRDAVSRATARSSNQKIRILLQPDFPVEAGPACHSHWNAHGKSKRRKDQFSFISDRTIACR